uniref:Uncharacterized protein n=1 Tax=Fundulus heteroclitus TaxID=8078 RepID=A0A3Q2PHC4_FUNHE
MLLCSEAIDCCCRLNIKYALSLHLSIFTATVITVSALESPYAVASTTFPNAPDPSVFPGKKKIRHKTILSPRLFFLSQTGRVPALRLCVQPPGRVESCLKRAVENNTQNMSTILCLHWMSAVAFFLRFRSCVFDVSLTDEDRDEEEEEEGLKQED